MAGARFLDPSSIPLKPQSGGNIWATLVTITQVIIVFVLLSGLMLFFLPVFQKTSSLQEKKDLYLNQIAAGQEEQEKLQLETEHMKNDPAYVEHIARDRLRMGRPGETILRFPRYEAAPDDPKIDANGDSNATP